MIERISVFQNNNTNLYGLNKNKSVDSLCNNNSIFKTENNNFTYNPVTFQGKPENTNTRTVLIGDEIQKYNEIVSNIVNTKNKQGEITQAKKLETLLQNGKLLSKNSNDSSTTLDNLYKILKTERHKDFNSINILNQTINTIYNPKIITQKFGDIPQNIKELILKNPETPQYIKDNPVLLDVDKTGSGTCPAASLEFNMADKNPAEFARWVNGLTSPDVSVKQKVNLRALNSNFLDAHWLIKDAFELNYDSLNLKDNTANLTLKPDKNAIKRAYLQKDYYDEGERTMIDVLIQSTLMQIGSEQSYDSLTDIRQGKFNSNPQGLNEFEKTFVESIATNKEKLSIVYQDIDENQYLRGYRTSFDKIERHIKQAIDNGDNVVIGYVFVDKNKKVKGGHEITIVDYRESRNGTTFICNDTDDNKNEYVEYKADYLLPKIHHAGYSADLVKGETALLNMS